MQQHPYVQPESAIEQRVDETVEEQRVEQRVAPPLMQITDAPPIITAPNPTAPQKSKKMKRTHSRLTRNNLPGGVPPIVNLGNRHCIEVPTTPTTPTISPQRSPCHVTLTELVIPTRIPKVCFIPIKGGIRLRNIISQEAINFLTECVWANSPDIYMPTKLRPDTGTTASFDFQHITMPMVHPTTGETISSYKCLMHDPATAEIWQTAFGKDFGGMAQGDEKTGQKGTKSIFVMTHDKIKNIPRTQTITYARIVVDFCPQKDDPYRICITAGGNLITYPEDLSTCTADLTTSKLMWNSVLSMEGAKYMCLDIKNFYLTAALDRYEYMKMPLMLSAKWIVKQYNLKAHSLNGFVYLEMRCTVWGLPQAGILANKLLRKCLLPQGYYKCANMSGLWKHIWRPISFTLVVDNFGVKYVGQEHVDHLIWCLKQQYKLTEDWTGNLYCGIALKWDYNVRTLDISMPVYIKKLLLKYKHRMPTKPQHCPYAPAPKQYGAKAQAPLPVNISLKLSPKEIKVIQQVIGSILYYARAVDITVLMALSSIDIEQSNSTTNTMEKAKQLLDYIATYPDATI